SGVGRSDIAAGYPPPALLFGRRWVPGRRATVRTILLWMARNPWLRARLPRLRFVRRAVGSFMPWEDLGSATAAASACRDDGIKAAFTRLGENLTDLGEAGAVADHYVEVLDEIERLGVAGASSIK